MDVLGKLKQNYLNSRAKELNRGGGSFADISRQELNEYIAIMATAAVILEWEIPSSPNSNASNGLVFVEEKKNGLPM